MHLLLILLLLIQSLSIFFIKGNPDFSNGSKILSKNPLDCSIFDNFILDDEPFGRALRSLETCVLVRLDEEN